MLAIVRLLLIQKEKCTFLAVIRFVSYIGNLTESKGDKNGIYKLLLL
jgi:hypothetical protein